MRELRFASASIRPHICFPSLLLFLLLLSLPLSQSQPASFRGIRKRDQALYIAANFTCFDSSASFPSSRVNDDYCDCADGSDEPGTSACPNSSFFCPNRGASSLSIHSSRVNDLICDCCDGSDEWASRGGPAACPNRCAEEGREKHKHVLEEIAATEAGVKTRQQLVEEAMRTKAEKEGKKAKYEATVADRQKVLDDAKAALAEQEKIEQAEKDRLKAVEDAETAEAARLQAEQQAQQAQQQPPTAEQLAEQQADPEFLKLAQQAEQDTAHVPADQQQEAQAPLGNTETPDAAQPDAEPAANFPYPAEYAYKPTEEAAVHHSTPAAAETVIEQEIENFPYPAEYAYHADATHTTTQTEESIEENAEEGGEEEEEEAPSGWAGVRPAGGSDEMAAPAAQPGEQSEPAKATSATYTLEGETQQHSLTQRLRKAIGQVVRDVRQTMPEVPPVVHEVLQLYGDAWRWLVNALFPKPLTPAEAATQAREVVKAAQEKLDRVQNKLNEVNKWLQADYGPDLAFASLAGQCFTYNHNQYTYEMCPYGNAHQKEGASSTSLGQWDGIKQRQEADDSVPTLSFTNGQHCWQGPARSLTAVMRCGVENVIRSVEEPSRCVYEMEFFTPTVCDMERARRLQKELEDQMAEAATEED